MALIRLLSIVIVGLGGVVEAQSGTAKGYDVLDYVDQLIGSSNGGLKIQVPAGEQRLTESQETSSLGRQFPMVSQ